MSLRPVNVTGQMQAILNTAKVACDGDPTMMIAGLVGALVITASMAGRLDDLLRIAIDALEATRELNRFASGGAIAPIGKGMPS